MKFFSSILALVSLLIASENRVLFNIQPGHVLPLAIAKCCQRLRGGTPIAGIGVALDVNGKGQVRFSEVYLQGDKDFIAVFNRYSWTWSCLVELLKRQVQGYVASQLLLSHSIEIGDCRLGTCLLQLTGGRFRPWSEAIPSILRIFLRAYLVRTPHVASLTAQGADCLGGRRARSGRLRDKHRRAARRSSNSPRRIPHHPRPDGPIAQGRG